MTAAKNGQVVANRVDAHIVVAKSVPSSSNHSTLAMILTGRRTIMIYFKLNCNNGIFSARGCFDGDSFAFGWQGHFCSFQTRYVSAEVDLYFTGL